jgi:hypothetical protein
MNINQEPTHFLDELGEFAFIFFGGFRLVLPDGDLRKDLLSVLLKNWEISFGFL